MQALAVIEKPELVAADPRSELLEAWLSGRSPQTIAAYSADLQDFAGFLDVSGTGQAAEALLSAGAGKANLLALRYRAALLERGLAPASINRKLSALRSLVKVARTIGLVTFALDVENVRSQAYRDTRGPGREGVQAMLGALQGRQDAKGARDRAMLHLLFDLGLRRAEVVSLDLEHLDLSGASVSVMGKGRRERITLTLPAPTVEAVAAWLTWRGDSAGPLFVSLDKSGHMGGRLTGRGLHKVIAGAGRQVGLRVWPHGLRHAAITASLDMTGGDVRSVARFSRHLDIRVLTRYDDNRTDAAGAIAALIAL